MKKIRITFSKTGRLIYISHLDLMRCMSRAFVRANVPIYHTEGFNPHPYMVFANSLSLGFAGEKEILEIRVPLDTDLEKIKTDMNLVLPNGLCIQSVAPAERPFQEISFAFYEAYSRDVLSPEERDMLSAFFKKDDIRVIKKGKKGPREINIAPWIAEAVCLDDGHTISLLLACSNTETLNPELLFGAVRTETGLPLPHLRFTRKYFLDEKQEEFV